MIASLTHLQRYAEEGGSCLNHIVTGDEMWILHVTLESKQHGAETTGFACDKKIRTVPSVEKVMLTAFWDFMPVGATFNADSYWSTLLRLRTVIRNKTSGILDVDKMVIFHDNARPHVTIGTVNKLWSFH